MIIEHLKITTYSMIWLINEKLNLEFKEENKFTIVFEIVEEEKIIKEMRFKWKLSKHWKKYLVLYISKIMKSNFIDKLENQVHQQ